MKKLALLLLTFWALLLPSAAIGEEIHPVHWSFSTESLGNNEYNLVFTAKIDAGWHMYSQFVDEGPVPTSFSFNENATYEKIGDVTETEPVMIYDGGFDKDLAIFEGEAIFKQRVKSLVDTVALVDGYLEFMACETGRCLSPEFVDFSFELKNVAVITAADAEQASDKGLLSMIIKAILWGLAALLTPCVFPMIPMTVSFFLHGSENKAVGRFKAIMYFVFIVLLYTLPIAIIIIVTWLFGGNSVTSDIFNWLSTNWIPNIIFFLVFMVFAASFFGAFEIVLPSKLVNKSDAKSEKKGLLGVFFMALTLVLVSFACTGPIVGTVLIDSTSGEFWTPIITMLCFACTFALPFALFALFPSMLKNMPKSGGWLNTVKVVLGFIEVALGFKFLSVADQTYHWGLLDREVYLGIWIVCFTMLGFYLLGKIRFKNDDPVESIGVGRLSLSIIVFTFVVYMIPGMWGAPLKALSGYLPPQQTMDFDMKRINEENTERIIKHINKKMNAVSIQSGKGLDFEDESDLCETPLYSEFLHLPHSLEGYFDYDQALKCAKAQNKPLFVDFTGHGCVNCREMEASVWSDPRVLDILREDYVVVALYVDDKTTMPEEQWIVGKDGMTRKEIGRKNAYFLSDKFNMNAQPYYCLLGHNGELLHEPRAYNLDRDGFVKFLKAGLENFKNGVSVRNINE